MNLHTPNLPAGPSRWSTLLLAMLCLIPFQGRAQEAMIVDSSGNVGIGVDQPSRQLHMLGTNAGFRMDRDVNNAGFFLVRTAPGDFNTIWKNYFVGVSSVGVDNGEFIINDLGTATLGGGTRRMTIANSGAVGFTGSVRAPAFVQTSAERYKQGIETLAGAGGSVDRLRGVRFTWKDSGRPSLGLVAEEVAAVYPELVETRDGQAEAVNYAALTAVLVEALKEQRAHLDAQRKELDALRARLDDLEAHSVRAGRRVAAGSLP